ncbi:MULTISPECIES: phenol hydroxylase subunit P4 [Neptuniibacter]|jgi:phenol hydroxylase P4 protein|uniref:phenol hydroxylase subunit P4 n=1 Tax=Neptuniibacter TaxID=459520 RepID=UPI00082F80EE|nr:MULTISPECIES: phenol hydroxylase subunit P4 [Neptuniibacter]MDO6513297.1 phenol hydroxylase subunit P4 [Neptuniibacter sp. 2_MG-2023]MDO6595040.1 phenol hydroxylase subunit P4 [Neptuniibacter sp. 1_MG-2023]
MPIHAITPEYKGEVLDKLENFNGNQVVYVGWDHHLMFCAAFAYPLPPEMPFRALLDDVMPEAFSLHPEFSKINWDKAEWLLDGQPFIPQLNASLIDQGIGHKSLLRFQTPELKGVQEAGI